MPKMTFDVTPEIQERLMSESQASQRSPDDLVALALDKYLEDQEDIREAMKVLAEVKAGRMEVYSWEEVKAHLYDDDELEDQIHEKRAV